MLSADVEAAKVVSELDALLELVHDSKGSHRHGWPRGGRFHVAIHIGSLINGKQVGLLEALRVKAESTRQTAAIHAHKMLESYGQPILTRSDAEAFLSWLREERGLSDCTIAGLMTHCRQRSGCNRHLFSHKLK